jgi:hypothetical protein
VLGIHHLDDQTDGGDTVGPGGASGYPAVVLADHPLVYLRLGEASGVRAADSSGNGNDGAYLGGIVLGVPGAIAGDPDTAARFHSTADSSGVRLGTGFNFPGASPFSVEAWVRPEDQVNGADDSIVEVTSFGPGWSLFMQSEILKFQRSDASVWFTAGLPHNVYSHVVATFDGAELHLYIGGVGVGDQASTTSLPDPPDQHLVVGSGYGFPGSLDEVAVYDHALTLDRIRAHYQAGTSPP